MKKESRFIIIEGIAGSGKSTISGNLIEEFTKSGHSVHFFNEFELTFSWKLLYIKGIEETRIKFMHTMLDYAEELLKDKNNIVIFERFHISFAIFSRFNGQIRKEYESLIKKLRKLNPLIIIGTLDEKKIEKRSSHIERKDKSWKAWLERKKKIFGFDNIKDLYINEQKLIFKIANKQKIPYVTFSL